MAEEKRITGEDLYESAKCGSGFKVSSEPLLDKIKTLGDNIIIAEIGVCKGLGMWKMLTECDNIGHAYGIDTWWTYGSDPFKMGLKNLNIARQSLHPFIGKNLSLIIDNSTKAHEMFPDEHFDYVFIDGDHTEVGCYRDLVSWYPKVKQGGLFAGHDYKNGQGVVEAVKKFCKKNDLEFKVIEGWVWYVKK